MIAKLSLLVFVTMTTSTKAQIVDDQHLRHVCLTRQPGEQAACAGYIVGIADASRTANQFCIPKTVSPAKVIDEVRKYIAKNPSHLPADEQVTLGLRTNWPCTDEAQKR